jgi:hypothetical protein
MRPHFALELVPLAFATRNEAVFRRKSGSLIIV